MSDVAKHAGVSQTAVSLVLNSPETSGIPLSTQRRIFDAVDAVGYRTNRLARAMRLDKTETFGFIADDIATTPYANQMIQGAQDAAWDAGHLLLVVNTGAVDHPDHHHLERDAIAQMLERQVDGIVFATMFHREIETPPTLSETRTVLLDARDVNGRLDSVVPDEVAAAATATQHLVDHGHRRIAHITVADPSAAPPARVNGYRSALTANGIEVDERLIITEASTTAGGRNALNRLLALDEAPSAVFCFNDQMAMGVYQAAKAAGLSIPHDLSVIGFDDQQLIAAELLPALTTMRLPHYEMGRWAVDQLLADPGDDPVQHSIACQLVERDSVADL